MHNIIFMVSDLMVLYLPIDLSLPYYHSSFLIYSPVSQNYPSKIGLLVSQQPVASC